MKISGSTNDQLMCMAAHRYCLGRRSYIGSCCREWLTSHWGQFEPTTQQVIVRDTLEWLHERVPGENDFDFRGWVQFGDWAWAKLDDESRKTVRRQVEWRLNQSVEDLLANLVDRE